jgi:hypothetical protein
MIEKYWLWSTLSSDLVASITKGIYRFKIKFNRDPIKIYVSTRDPELQGVKKLMGIPVESKTYLRKGDAAFIVDQP